MAEQCGIILSMPSGVIHRKYLYRSLPLMFLVGILPTALVYLLTSSLSAVALWLVGYITGLVGLSRYVDPDADQLSLTLSEGRLMRELGMFGFLIVWWMMPYAYIMKWFGGHRGLSHVHIIGTATRVLWLFWPIAFTFWWFDMPISVYILHLLCGITCGLCMADSNHIYLDNHAYLARRIK